MENESAGAAAGSPALRCRALTKRYGDLVAVDRLDLEVARGECFGLLGPNGAGKTTTIEILEGLLEPDEGRVEVLGRSWREGGRALRERLGIQLQETRLADKLTVRETLRLFRSFYPRGRSVEEVMELVGLGGKAGSWVGRLSGGQRQRLAVACALVGDPELLFLDEPTTGLDPQSRHQLWEVIQEFRARGGTVLLTTHYMEEAARLCDRVGIMDGGRIIALGRPAELVAGLGAEHVVEFSLDGDGALEPDRWLRVPGVRRVHAADGVVALTVTEVHRTVPALLREIGRAGARLSGLQVHHATLEDVFMALTGRHLRDG